MVPRIRLALVALTLAGSLASGGLPARAQTSSTGASRSDPLLEGLRERVQAYWQARVEKNYRAEYELLEPRARAVLDPEQYGRGRTVEYLAVQVEDVERRGHFAQVGVRLLVRVQIPAMLPRMPGISRNESTLLQDGWVRVGGTWYRTREADAGSPLPWPAVDE